MKKSILTYGLISGAVAAVMMVLMCLVLLRSNKFDSAEWYGYSGILLSMLFVFFGVRSYRDQELGGSIGFGRAFLSGMLIVLISSLCYAVTWLFVYKNMMPDFMERFAQYTLEKMKTAGAAESEIQAKTAEMQGYKAWYGNPLSIIALTLIEPMPVGFLVALISAAVLRKKGENG